ncbi:hypothetical protein PVAP13_2NG459803 [Panicum virgatum]|uniref:Uncharacterized protein n=1 Tax=Panicum virgatum TaxID=38727 RepID=A0A8T0VJZ0_PANVG|nr:hypothetical protein PVAP13_2NG459803 [Panicum virgatum]
MSKLPFPIFLLFAFSFYVFLYFSSYFFSFLFPSHSLSLSIQGASSRLQLPLPAGCSAPARAAPACELLLCRRCFCLLAAPPLLLLPAGCLELRLGAAAWRRWLRPAPRARREMPSAAREEADGRRRRRRELPPARRPSPTDRPPLPRLPPAVHARRASATPASPTRGQGWEKVPRSCSEPAGATFLWLRLARSAPVTRILGTWSRNRPWSTPFGRAPGEAGFGVGVAIHIVYINE